jgi:hypothetical protein
MKSLVGEKGLKVLVRSVPVVVLGVVPVVLAGCPGEDNPLCCGEGDFQVGGTITVGGSAGVAMQAVADFAAIASGSIDDLTAACRTIAEDLDAPKAERDAAEQNPDKRAKMDVYCQLAVDAIGAFKAEAGGTLTIDFQPPVCEASISAKADCQAKCSGSASCDLQANPPTCEGGTLEISCSGSCTAEAGASVYCEGGCTGECTGECTAEGGVDCEGECDGTCMGTLNSDGSCSGQCNGTCRATAPGAQCSGTCKGQCDAACQATAEASVKCDGTCDAEYEPLKCSGGELKGGCTAEAKCEANCDASVQAKAECRPPSLAITFSGAANAEVAGKLKLVLEANLGVVVALEARLSGMFDIVGTFVGSVDANVLAEIKIACIPVIIAAVGEAAGDVEASFTATGSLIASVN